MKTLTPVFFLSIKWQDFVGLVISGGFLYATLRQTSDSLWHTSLTKEQWLLSIAAGLCTIAVMVIQAYRMRWFLAPAPWRIEQISGFPSVNIGNFYNGVLPGNVGELIRTHHFARKNQIPFSTAMGCWIGEKFIDGMLMALFCIVLFLTPEFDVSVLRWIILVPITSAIFCLAFIKLSYRWPSIIRKLFTFIPTRKLGVTLFKSFLQFKYRLLSVSGRFRLAIFIFCALCMAAFNAAGFTVNLLAAGVPTELICVNSLFVLMILMAVVYFIPSAPSSVGVMHYGVYTSLVLLAEMEDLILTPELKDSFVLAAIFFHATYFIPEVFLGFIYLIRERRLVFAIRHENTNDKGR